MGGKEDKIQVKVRLDAGDLQSTVHGFPRQADHFFSGMSNRVEHQKLSQVAAFNSAFGRHRH